MSAHVYLGDRKLSARLHHQGTRGPTITLASSEQLAYDRVHRQNPHLCHAEQTYRKLLVLFPTVHDASQ